MAQRDEKGFIRYSHEELDRVPSFEVRTAAPAGPMGAVGTSTFATLAGAAFGSLYGPVGTIVGGVAGAAVGGAGGAAMAAGRNQDPRTRR